MAVAFQGEATVDVFFLGCEGQVFAWLHSSWSIEWAHHFRKINTTKRSVGLRVFILFMGTRIACWSENQTWDWTVASSNPCRNGERISPPESTVVCWLLFHVRSTPVSLQWHIKDPGHSTKNAGGRLHLNTHAPLAQQSQSGLTRPLSRHSVGIFQETSSHKTHQGTLDHSHLSLLNHYGLILA